MSNSFRVIFLSLMCICCFSLILTYLYIGNIMVKKKSEFDDLKFCFQIQKNIPGLVDNILDAEIQPKPGGSIFFHETSCRKPQVSNSDSMFSWLKTVHINMANLTAREACAVESAALHNPNSTVFVLFASPVTWFDNSNDKIMHAILSYPNVHIRNLDMWQYAYGSSIYDWFMSDKVFSSKYLINNLSNILRILTLWRYGGTYLDLDIISLDSLEDLPPNYVGAETIKYLNNAVLNCEQYGIGRKVIDYTLQEFQTHFNGNVWGNNGPKVITRALKRICQTDKIIDMFIYGRCKGFKVFKPNAFYAIYPWDWRKLFNETYKNEMLEKVRDSYVVHMWNRLSRNKKHFIGTSDAYGELASKNCPKVYSSVDEFM